MEKELDNLLAESQKKYEEIENNIKDKKGLLIWGAGLYGKFCIEYLQKSGYEIIGIIDKSVTKQGQIINGVKVISPENDLVKKAKGIFITARHVVDEILKENKIPVPIINFDAWFIHKNFDKYKKILEEKFEDEKSKKVLENLLMAKISGKEKYYADVYESNQYFALPDFVSGQYENFVDAGAYVGDTAECFIFIHNGFFENLYLFEPGKEAFAAMKKRAKRLTEEWAKNKKSIHCIKAAVGEKPSFVYFEKNNNWGQGFSLSNFGIGENKEKVQVYSLDTCKEIKSVSFLKADIEGMEIPFLNGAKEKILKYRPKMAICAYHRPDDILSIIDWVEKLNLNYKISIRHHSAISEETVLYFY